MVQPGVCLQVDKYKSQAWAANILGDQLREQVKILEQEKTDMHKLVNYELQPQWESMQAEIAQLQKQNLRHHHTLRKFH